MKHPNYLTSFRRRYALSEQELANLVGYASRATVYRFARGERPPTLRFALACQLIFGVEPRKIFPLIAAKIEDDVLGRAVKLDQDIRGKTGESAARKRSLLLAIVERAGKSEII